MSKEASGATTETERPAEVKPRDEPGPWVRPGRLSANSEDGMRMILDFPRPPGLATVDVLISVKDVKPIFLHKMLWSIHHQTYPYIASIIVTDDGSTNEETKTLLRAWRDKGLIHKLIDNVVNRGIGASWNRMIRETSADYVFIMGADDAVMPNYLAEIIGAMEATPAIEVLGTYCWIIDDVDKAIRKWNVLAAGIYRRTVFEKRGLWFDETRKRQVDSELQERLLDAGGVIRSGAEPLYFYRWHADNVTGRAAEIAALKTKRGLREYTGSPVAVVGPGCPFHAETAAKVLEAKFIDVSSDEDLDAYRLIYFMGNFIVQEQMCELLTHLKTDADRVLFMHWVGSDVLMWRGIDDAGVPYETKPEWLEKLKLYIDQHFCEHEEMQKELKEHLGIDAEVLPAPLRRLLKPEPLPAKFRVHCYSPRRREAFYNRPFWEEVQKETGYDFVYADGALPHEQNIELLKLCTVAVRMTPHEGGVPHTLAEAKMLGRYAIFNHKLPHVTYAESKEQAVRALRKFAALQAFEYDRQGAQFYQEYFSRKKFGDRFYYHVNHWLRLMKEQKLKSQEADAVAGQTGLEGPATEK